VKQSKTKEVTLHYIGDRRNCKKI